MFGCPQACLPHRDNIHAVDFFAGTNVMAIVAEIDAATTVDENTDNYLQIWATTGVTP